MMLVENLVHKITNTYSSITGIECDHAILEKGEAHRPSTLGKGEQGVYVFYINDVCLKVGKAGPKSKARWNSHHYNLDTTTPSTMTKSIIKNLNTIKELCGNIPLSDVDMHPKNIKEWVRNNTSRIELKIAASESKFALGLLESLVQYYFNPVFERTTNKNNRIKFK